MSEKLIKHNNQLNTKTANMSAVRQSERRLSIQNANKNNAYFTIVADTANLASAEPRARSCSPLQAPKERNQSNNDTKSAKTTPALNAKTSVRGSSTTKSLELSVSIPAASWSEQCKTPTQTIPAILTHTTNVPVTTLAFNSTLTTTTSTIFTSAPIMSTSILASQQTSTNKQQQQTLNENNAKKRTRNSPSKLEEGAKTNKKHKTQTTKQTSLNSYWLSDANRYAPLADIEHSEQTVSACDSGTNQKAVQSKTNAKNISKPPPIYVQNVENINKLITALNALPNNKYVLKVLSNNEIKIQAKEPANYSSMIKLLKDKNTQYYTFKPKEQRGFKVILRNMHHSANTDEIIQELKELGHEVTHIHNILQSGTKKPLPLFSIELNLNQNNKDIYSVTSLLHCKINFEPPHQKRTIPQCTNCQKYGHTQNFCTKMPVCVKCAGEHKTSDCKLSIDNNNTKCALCGGNHTANYKGCMVYKTLKIQRFPALRPKTLTTNNTEDNMQPSTQSTKDKPSQPSTVTPNLTFAQAAALNATPHQTSPELTTTNNEIHEIKDMMKQLIAQMSNMMSIITLLVTKLNEQTK